MSVNTPLNYDAKVSNVTYITKYLVTYFSKVNFRGIKMIDLKEFRKANNLKQEDVANYLSTSRVFISQVEGGKSKLPSEQLCKLLSNPYGWDTTMLEQSPTINTRVSGNGSANVQVGSNNKLVQDSSDLKVQIAVLEKENELLREQRELLLEQNDFLKTLLNK